MNVESVKDLWSLICEDLKKKITEVSFDLWISDLHPVELKGGELTLSIYSTYKRNIVENNYISVLEESAKTIMGLDIKIKIVNEDEQGCVITEKPIINTNSFEQTFTFENFIVGSTNRFAHAASMAVADSAEGNHPYNPLVIYGRSGVGKTHLLLAIKNRILEKFPQKRVEYVRCEDFTNQLIQSINEGKLGMGSIDDFRNRYRNCDVLLVDDVQFIAGKTQTQEEFFNTFNTLYQNNKQIVVTLDRPAKEVRTLDDRIRSRFEDGMYADINPPDFETKVGIINKKAEQLGIRLTDGIIYYIAEHIKDNTRQLEGVVKKIYAMVQMDKRTPTLVAVQEFIRDVVSDTKAEPVRIEKILAEVARTYNVSESDILSKRRTQDIVDARQAAMYIAREVTDLPYDAIGQSFGRNHTTVLYTENKMREILKNRPTEKAKIEDIISNLKNET